MIRADGTSLLSIKGFFAVCVSTFASVICLLLIVVVLFIASTVTSPLGVIALDIALAAIILFFRSLKPLETPLSRLLGLTDWPAFSKPRQATGSCRMVSNQQVGYILNSLAALISDSNSTNAVNFSSAWTTKLFPSSRCASAIQIVRPLESIAETQPRFTPSSKG
jgi:hypothetical protein